MTEKEKLIQALTPFAHWLDDLDMEFADHDDDVIVAGRGLHTITFGDLRRARAAISEQTEGKDADTR